MKTISRYKDSLVYLIVSIIILIIVFFHYKDVIIIQNTWIKVEGNLLRIEYEIKDEEDFHRGVYFCDINGEEYILNGKYYGIRKDIDKTKTFFIDPNDFSNYQEACIFDEFIFAFIFSIICILITIVTFFDTKKQIEK